MEAARQGRGSLTLTVWFFRQEQAKREEWHANFGEPWRSLANSGELEGSSEFAARVFGWCSLGLLLCSLVLSFEKQKQNIRAEGSLSLELRPSQFLLGGREERGGEGYGIHRTPSSVDLQFPVSDKIFKIAIEAINNCNIAAEAMTMQDTHWPFQDGVFSQNLMCSSEQSYPP